MSHLSPKNLTSFKKKTTDYDGLLDLEFFIYNNITAGNNGLNYFRSAVQEDNEPVDIYFLKYPSHYTYEHPETKKMTPIWELKIVIGWGPYQEKNTYLDLNKQVNKILHFIKYGKDYEIIIKNKWLKRQIKRVKEKEDSELKKKFKI